LPVALLTLATQCVLARSDVYKMASNCVVSADLFRSHIKPGRRIELVDASAQLVVHYSPLQID
jgi:hypothetical protein